MKVPWMKTLVFKKTVPTDGSWWIGVDRSTFKTYVAANVKRMSAGSAASFVAGTEGYGSKDRESLSRLPSVADVLKEAKS